MKLEIEITEDEIKSAIERKIRVAIAAENSTYAADAYIKAKVKEMWQDSANRMIYTALSDYEGLHAKVAKSLEAKINGQLQALLRVKK